MALKPADMTRLMDNARVSLPGSLDGAIQLEIFNVLNEFFQRTNIWTEKVPFSIDNTARCGDEIEISVANGQIIRLMQVLDQTGYMRNMAMSVPGVLQVIDRANEATTWNATVALSVKDPVVAATNLPVCPGWIMTKYNVGILNGVMGRMMLQPAKAYSNRAQGAVRWQSFLSTCSQAKAEAMHANRYGAQRWTYPQDFIPVRYR